MTASEKELRRLRLSRCQSSNAGDIIFFEGRAQSFCIYSIRFVEIVKQIPKLRALFALSCSPFYRCQASTLEGESISCYCKGGNRLKSGKNQTHLRICFSQILIHDVLVYQIPHPKNKNSGRLYPKRVVYQCNKEFGVLGCNTIFLKSKNT